MPEQLKPAEYHRLAREIDAQPAGTRPVLAVLSTFTADLLRPYLTVECQRLDCPVRCWFAPFGSLEQMVLDEHSELWRQSPDVVWIALRLEDVDRHLVYQATGLGPDETANRLEVIRERLVQLAQAARGRNKASILISNLALPPMYPPGTFDASDPDSVGYLVAESNRCLARELAKMPDAHVFDYAGTIAEQGARRWHDPKLWHMARAACSSDNHPALAQSVARRVAALLRPAAKCLVLDLDNTLWGGVLGDDGPQGIKLGDDYPGSVFKDFQAALLNYRQRGFLLAIASKNDEATVLEMLDSHPEMLLRRDHFASIMVNWDPKPAGLRRVAEALNIGLDSLIFIDDNPVERAQVRAELPMVHVVELPADPLQFLPALHEVALLDRPRVLEEDRQRAEMYQSDARRQQVQQTAASVEDFLRELHMVAEVGLCKPQTLERVHQLIDKTNQFNLTTRRHKLDEVRWMAESNDARVAWLRLRDRYGDSGLVGVGIVVRRSPDDWEIDTLLMSCRVMGRKVEDAMLAHLAQLAKATGARRLRGVFRPTAKNRPVEKFYPEHGFVEAAESKGEQTYEIDLANGVLPWPEIIERIDAE